MEYLETNGVPVLGYRTTELPAFWSRNSGIYGILPYQTASEIASFLNLKWGFPLAGGALVTNPVSDADEIPELQVRAWIEDALNETKSQKITGKEITPFILDYIRLASKGRSVKTNISLVKNNAKLAAQIAIELKKCN